MEINVLRQKMLKGMVICAHPLALDAGRKFDVRHQRALTRYYLDAGVGGIAVGVHSTQFAIRDPKIGLFGPVLELAAETVKAAERDVVKVAGVCGDTGQALREATFAREADYDAVLLSLAAWKGASISDMITHCRAVAETLPLIGFYLQPAAGGCLLPYEFWREFAEIESVVAIKMAPFNRYQTLDVIRGVCEAGREQEIALYTGNDDNILVDLLTEFRVGTSTGVKTARIVGGLLGHWAVWTKRAVEQHTMIRELVVSQKPVPAELLTLATQVTESNAAFFDAANGFAGCIPGIHEVLRGQGLLQGTWCLNPDEQLSPGQVQAIARVRQAYPHLHDDDFVAENIDRWL